MKVKSWTVFIFLPLLFFYSCSKHIDKNVSSSYMYDEDVQYDGAYSVKSRSAKLTKAKEAFPEANLMTTADSVTNNFERKLIKNGSFSIEVQNLSDTEQNLRKWTETFSGYVESSYVGETDGTLSIRIPSEKFEEAMNSAGLFGILKSKNIFSEDVSEQFYDLESRLSTKKIIKERLEKYLTNAKDMADMLKIERELNSVISELESMEGRMKYLSSQIDFSRITITFSLPYRAKQDSHFVMPDFGDGFRRFAANVIDFFIMFIKVMFYIVIFGIPIIAAIAFFYWLLIGKMGLLKKLYFMLSDKK